MSAVCLPPSQPLWSISRRFPWHPWCTLCKPSWFLFMCVRRRSRDASRTAVALMQEVEGTMVTRNHVKRAARGSEPDSNKPIPGLRSLVCALVAVVCHVVCRVSAYPVTRFGAYHAFARIHCSVIIAPCSLMEAMPPTLPKKKRVLMHQLPLPVRVSVPPTL